MTPTPDQRLVTQVLFRVRNGGPVHRTGWLWLHFGDTSDTTFGYKCAVSERLPPALLHAREGAFGRVAGGVRYVLPAPAAGEVLQHARVEIAGAIGAAERVLEWAVPLAPGEHADLVLQLPFGLVTEDQAKRLAALDPEQVLHQVKSFWQHLQSGPGGLITPDPFVNDYLVAVSGQMAQQVAYRQFSDRLWMYKTSPNWYEFYWPCNAAKALPAFDFRGLTDLSRPVLQTFVERQTSDAMGMDHGAMHSDHGSRGEGFAEVPGFLGNMGEWTANPLPYSHGVVLWALASHFRITRDEAWLGEGPGSPLQAMLDGCAWVAHQRRRTMRAEHGEPVAHWGLLPAASAHDWAFGNAIWNDAACLFGMIEVVRVLREIGHPRSEEMAQEVQEYRATYRARVEAATVKARRLPLPDGAELPYVPRMTEELDWAKTDWTYTGYGPLRAGAWGALDAHDPLVTEALAFLEAGLPAGEGYYFFAAGAFGKEGTADVNFASVSNPTAERHYLWRHYVEYETMWPIFGSLFLERDDLPRFFEGLWHNLAIALHHDFRVGVESLDGVPSCAPGEGERWQILRRMFVNEVIGEETFRQRLFLLQALPREWLKPGCRMAMRDMGTWFGGRIDLTVEVDPAGDQHVEVVWHDLKALPEAILIRLRGGDGRSLGVVTINAEPVALGAGGVINLPCAQDGRYQILARLEKESLV